MHYELSQLQSQMNIDANSPAHAYFNSVAISEYLTLQCML